MKKLKENRAFEYIISILVCIISGFGVAIGVRVFLTPNNFVSSGFTGIAMLIGRLYDKIFASHIEAQITGILYFILNIPIMILAWRKLSKRFAILSAIQAITSSIVITLLPDNLAELIHLNNLGLLEVSIFVGLFNGFFNAIAFMVGGSAGGLDVLSMYFAIKKQTNVGIITTGLNMIILVSSVFVNGLENGGLTLALYTLIYIIISSLVIDFFYSRNKRVVLFITTTKGEEITNIITHQYVRGVTKINAKGGFTNEDKNMLYCACLSVEAPLIIETVKSIDEHAFISIINVTKLYGNFLSKEIKS